jgi:hypothetical protein
VNERGGNVYENKGSAFNRRGKSGNVIENKSGYASKARMLLKTKDPTGLRTAETTTVLHHPLPPPQLRRGVGSAKTGVVCAPFQEV